MILKLEKEEFKQWLKNRYRWKVVGYACSPTACPLAAYIMEHHKDVLYAYVTGTKVTYYATGQFAIGESVTHLPDWAVEFTEIVDWNRFYQGVRAGYCLRVLNGIGG